ncbi:argininosuccinate lyase [Marinomonas aquimarina]|uniref:Argininosuccinate lyase n=1 Tax=Marinomonas aquimarina TaxID=295068 RepID=A0A1A8TCI9_9GAMM|nr:ATP-grasp domain-containing protein [Marinomonas aquimarina]SBS30772.1 argininosuccinate lyase [Marinomonas aquimarina]
MSCAIIITHVVNDAVIQGFTPAAQAISDMTVVITDRKLEHLEEASRSDCFAPDLILECDVFNPLDIIDVIVNQGLNPSIVFSNSDHLQTSCALVAEFFKLPAKPWQTCLTAKNKHLTRQSLQELGLPSVPSWLIVAPSELPQDIVFPVVAKPKEGVASMDVARCDTAQQLEEYCQAFWQKHQHGAILLERFIEGPLITLETLGDGQELVAIGGFDVSLSEPPYFIEASALWNGPITRQYREECLAQLKAFGVGFGVCHSEFIISESGPILVEVNYRSIGDGREFLLDNLSSYGWFHSILRLHQGHELPGSPTIQGSALIHYIVAEQDGMVSQQHAPFIQQQDDVRIQYQVLKHEGESFTRSFSNKDYLARLVLTSPVIKDLNEALQEALSAINVTLVEEAVA